MAKDLERAVDMLAKAALAPGFPEEELVREKALLAAEIAGTKDNPMAFASREFIRALAGSHPYAHPVEGSEESVGALTREKVLAFYRASYVPRGAVLAVVGDVDAKKALELVKARFGGWKGEAAAKSIPALEPKPYPGRRVLVVDKADATQSQIRFGNVTVQRGTSEEFPLVVSNTVLGGGFTSRLMDEIRVNRGLSYGARSTNSNFKHGGIFGVYTYTKNASLRECVDVALEQGERMRTEKLTNAELSSAKKYITGLFPFDVETNGDLANWLVDLTFYGIPLSYVEEYGSKIDAVSADDCLAAARKRYWRDDNLMFLMTKYDETKPQLEGLGKIEVVNIADVK
jgi:zinc protease